jgi:hypothetical protein
MRKLQYLPKLQKLREEQLEMYFQTIVSDAELIAHPVVKTFLRIFDTSTPVLSLTSTN